MNRSKFLAKANSGLFNKVLSGAVISLAALASVPAQATNIGFEGVAPDLFSGGATFSESGYTMTVLDGANNQGGLSGAAIIGADSFTCYIIACPTGNASSYFAGLNDGGLNFSRSDMQGFKVQSLDFAFVAPLGGLIDFSVGKLVLTGKDTGGGIVQAAMDFSPQVNGEYTFSNWAIGGAFGNTVLTEFSVNACLYAGDGSCVSPAMNQAQFGLDNVNVAAVPEPSTYLMMGLGLAGLAAFTRRRRQA